MKSKNVRVEKSCNNSKQKPESNRVAFVLEPKEVQMLSSSLSWPSVWHFAFQLYMTYLVFLAFKLSSPMAQITNSLMSTIVMKLLSSPRLTKELNFTSKNRLYL